MILAPDKSVPIVAVNLWYHVGSKDETADRTGFAHLFEHMMFQGSANVGKTQHFSYIQNVGGTLNASTSFDRTNYFNTLPSDQIELALWLESDRMMSLAVTQENFANQLAVVKEERSQRYDNQPYGRTYENVATNLFAGTSYGWSTIGSMAHLDASTIADVKGFHEAWYKPNNASLCICGDYDETTVRTLIEKYFGTIAESPLPDRNGFVADTLAKGGRTIVHDTVPTPAVSIAFRGTPVYSEDDFALDVLSNVLSRGRSSRLYQTLLYEKQLVKSISAMNISLEKTGIFLIHALANPGISTEHIEEEIWNVLNEVRIHGISDAELEKAKNGSEISTVSQYQMLARRADALQEAYTYTRDTNKINSTLSRLLDVDVAHTKTASEKYLHPDKSFTIITQAP